VKKKSPPYAIIGAVILGIIAIAAFIQWKKIQDQKAADDKAAALAEITKERDDALANKVSVAPTATNMRNVLYATQPVEPGIRINSAFFETKPTPTDILPDAYSDKDDVVGWFAVRKIEKGDPLTPRNVNKSPAYMSQRITPGMRAISLPVFNAELNDTGGFIVDGDKVDLLYTTSTLDNFIIQTQLVMQNLSVLYVPGPTIKTEKTDGVNPAPAPGEPIAVTFEVTPEQAQALVFMTRIKQGSFSMILRSRKDTAEIKVKPFAAENYQDGFGKVQAKVVDPSIERVQELAAKIEAAEKTQGNTNDTSTPTPPSP